MATDRYSAVANSPYWFYNSYSAKEILSAMVTQIEWYVDFLKENGQEAAVSDVSVSYRFDDRRIEGWMRDIRENGIGKGKSKMPEVQAETEVFSAEALTDFVRRFDKISEKHVEEFKKKNLKGQTPTIPFSNIVLHFPAGVLQTAEVRGSNWKPLFNAVMDACCEATNGVFCEMRAEQEANKEIVLPKVILKGNLPEDEKKKRLYQPIGDGTYYFYNSYSALALVKELRKEISAYMNYLAETQGVQEDIHGVKISYELPQGEYAEMFK